MNSIDLLNAYLQRVEHKLRMAAVSRGAAWMAASALAGTVIAVLIANRLVFSESSIMGARLGLFLTVALAAAFGLIMPLLRLNRRNAAHRVEAKLPELEQRMVTLIERGTESGEEAAGSTLGVQDESPKPEPDPFLQLLAAETLELVNKTEPERVTPKKATAVFASIAAVAAAALIWLIVAGPGYWGYGASLLWAGPPKTGIQPYYEIVVTPGDATIRRNSDHLITARLVGFEAQNVRLSARYNSASRWEEAQMRGQAGGTGFELLLAGVPDGFEYFVEAGGVRSKNYTVRVIDLPGIKRIRVTYRYPQWTGMPVSIEEPGGDLRAVRGTEAEIAIETDKPLEDGLIVLDDGTQIPLQAGEGNWRIGKLTIQENKSYHFAALSRTGSAAGRVRREAVRLSDEYFIEAQGDLNPMLRVSRPGRDTRVSPIEEVAFTVEAEDDFGLHSLELRYSVNAGPEQVVSLLERKGLTQTAGSTTLYLEDFKLAPGDVVAFYARARDARNATDTDIFYLEAQPFEREYSQSQQMGGGSSGGESGEQDQNQISERQKEIIAATWNQIREKNRDEDTAKFLSEMQSKLRDQAGSLAKRMQARELAGTNQEFQTFSQEMEQASTAMDEAAGKLKSGRWQEALPPEQKALQHILRAESTFRRIQVAFGNNRGGGGGGGGSMGRDLEDLFELELDTEKNQYETSQRAAAQSPQQRELDEALQKLEQLARRQRDMARNQQNRQSFEQRWQQEMLRREAEQLQKRMEQLTRGGSGGQSGQSSQQQSGRPSQSASNPSGSERERLRSMGRPQVDPRVQQALDKLAEAARDMGRPGSQERAAQQLQEAHDLLGGMRQQEAGAQMNDLANRSEKLAQHQQDFANRLRRAFGDPTAQPLSSRNRQEAEKLAAEKQEMLSELQRLERDMQQGARDLANSQRAAASRLRDALGELQQQELTTRMRYNAEMIRRGMGSYAIMREAPVTAGLQELRDRLRDAQRALNQDPGRSQSNEVAEALDRLGRARDRLAQSVEGQRGQQRQGEGGQQSGQGGQQQAGTQPGSQQAGQGGRGQEGGGGIRAGNQRSLDGRRTGTAGEGGRDWAAMNFGDWQPAGPGSAPRGPDTAAATQAYRDAMRELTQLRQSLEGTPEVARDIDDLLREMQRFDPRRTPGNPALLEQMAIRFLPGLDRIELQIRRELGQGGSGQALAAESERVPPGFTDAVAEYFRRLSKKQ